MAVADLVNVMTSTRCTGLNHGGCLIARASSATGNDWSLDELRSRARPAIENTGERVDQDAFERFADRLSYLPGDFNDPGTFSRVTEAIARTRTPVFYSGRTRGL